MRNRWRWAASLGLVVLGTVLGLGLAELTLRVAGFSYRNFPTVQFGWPEPKSLVEFYRPDPDLFWVTKDYDQQLEAGRRHRPDVVFMGDSCTQFGSYPVQTMERLIREQVGLRVGLKLGVGGWSSEQGLAQLRRDVLPLHPRVITVYYGWNDHWVAFGPSDAAARPGRAWWWLTQHSRLAQLVSRAFASRAVRLAGRPNRVPRSRYIQNLEAIVALARAEGVRVVLITAPANHQAGREPEYLRARHLRRLQDLVPLHQTYVEATRYAAHATGATLCDAAQAFDADPSHASYFERDGIHLNRAGNRAMAEILAPCIAHAWASAP